MLTIKLTVRYMHDYKQEKQGRHRANLDKKLLIALRSLTTDVALPAQTHDLVLNSNLKDCGYCLIKPNLVLIYRKNGDNTLELVRLGSHNELSI